MKELVDGASRNILASFWWSEGKHLIEKLESAARRGVTVTTIQFGPNIVEVGRVFHHVIVDTVVERHGSEAVSVTDSESGLFMGQTPGQDWDGYWTNNPGVVRLITNYIRHDIYTNKLVWRFGDLIKSAYGKDFEKLLDIVND